MRAVSLALVVCALCACGDVAIEELVTSEEELRHDYDAFPAWVVNPLELDESFYGTSNCSPHVSGDPRRFHFGGNTGCGLEVQHEDSVCWERPTGHDGWIRQHQQRMHCDSSPACGGGPADLTVVRLCRDPGVGEPGSWPLQDSLVCGKAGPYGCAPCFRIALDCH